MITIMHTIKCDMPSTFKTNCKIKTKIEHGGIRNRSAKFEIVVRRLIHYTKHLSALKKKKKKKKTILFDRKTDITRIHVTMVINNQ